MKSVLISCGLLEHGCHCVLPADLVTAGVTSLLLQRRTPAVKWPMSVSYVAECGGQYRGQITKRHDWQAFLAQARKPRAVTCPKAVI